MPNFSTFAPDYFLGQGQRQLIAYAQARHRADLVAVFVARPVGGAGDRVARAIETLRALPAVVPSITDAVEMWLPSRIATALHAHGIGTLAELAVRISRRRRWWLPVAGLGAASARHIEAFFTSNPALHARTHAIDVVAPVGGVAPWERLRVPHEVDGSCGQFRAPKAACLLNASNDYEAIQSWLLLHESAATQRAYRKEAERLIL